MLSIVGTAKIIFDKTGDLKNLQDYALEKFSKPLPTLDGEDAKEYVSIINNGMEKLDKVNKLFEYSKRNVKLNEEDYRILIKSRNK